MSTTSAARPASTARTTKQKVGLGLAGLYCLTNVPSVLFAAPEGETGPPMAVMIACTIAGVVGVLATVPAWRSGHRVATRILAACLVLITVTSLPALFVDVPAGIKALVAFSIVWVLVSLVLVFSGREESAGVTP